jgi:peptide deformylase
MRRAHPLTLGPTSLISTAMAILPIIKLPDPILRQISTPIETIDDEVRRLAADMLETMYKAPGVGLAGIQVAVPRRILVLDVSEKEDEPEPIVMINPQILTLGNELRMHEEGCLSIPDTHVEIERPSTLRVRYLNELGSQIERDAEGLLATAIQHEINHLDGRLIIDFLSKMRRDMVIRKFKKTARIGPA